MVKTKKADSGTDLTPAMQRYLEIKEAHKDYLIFYRMGDFYELFFEDAEVASAALDIALTHRGKTEGKQIPMCGVPFHAYENYLARLIHQGYKVAICEQSETPEEAKKRGSNAILRRDVVRLVTAGTLTEDNLLNARKNNYLLCCVPNGCEVGLAWIDLSTADFLTQTIKTSERTLATDLLSVFGRLDPTEIILPDQMIQNRNLFQLFNMYRDKLTPMPQARFHTMNAEKCLENVFKVASLASFGEFTKAEITAAGIIIDYIQTTQKGKMPCLKHPSRFNDTQYMQIDAATRQNLELSVSVSGDRKASLLGTIDRTVTGAGARLLAHRLNNPSTSLEEINTRLDLIDFFIEIPEIRQELRQNLKNCTDIERSVSRLSLGRGGPRDLAQVGETLALIPRIKNLIFAYGRYKKLLNGLPQGLSKMLDSFGEFSALVDELKRALVEAENLPLYNRDGGFIRAGYSAALDALHETKADSHTRIAELEKQYIQETGVSALKIRYNSVLGYFIEIPTKFSKDIFQNPKFIHRQSVLTAARFTTAELNEADRETSHAGEKAVALEIELYNSLAYDVIARAQSIAEAAGILAALDVASSLADLAAEKKYCRPIVDGSMTFEIRGGRHPVVEASLERTHEGNFIGNDCLLDAETNRIWLLTGPNMAGKSTFLRQNAIIAIMAQMGAYVPCQSAHVGIIDKIFSRVGAADDLSRGRSTFMVEMVETASIINQATERSFVILDEIGRGTATYDGLSIAWSVVEHLHEVNRCRSLFATHYHELTVLATKLKALSLHCMKIKEFKDNIIFMHEVIDGTADRSYGIHVARLAGLPELVLKRAEQILTSLEQNPHNGSIAAIEDDLPLFAAFKASAEQKKEETPLTQALKELNPDDFSPRDALDKLYELKKLFETSEHR
jgi:DNA mismatch repair protein MutS